MYDFKVIIFEQRIKTRRSHFTKSSQDRNFRRLVESSAQNSYDRTGAVFGATYVNQDYVSDLRDSSLPFIAYDSRPVSLLFTEEGNRSAELLLRSSNTTVAVPS